MRRRARCRRSGSACPPPSESAGDPINGSSFRDILELFENDPETDAVMMIGEIGGPQEAEAAEYVRDHMTKPVAAYVAGLSAPKGRKMGHAGAIISAFGESAQEKVVILQEAGITVAPNPSMMGDTVAQDPEHEGSRMSRVEIISHGRHEARRGLGRAHRGALGLLTPQLAGMLKAAVSHPRRSTGTRGERRFCRGSGTGRRFRNSCRCPNWARTGTRSSEASCRRSPSSGGCGRRAS
jgi:hypothetical protein